METSMRVIGRGLRGVLHGRERRAVRVAVAAAGLELSPLDTSLASRNPTGHAAGARATALLGVAAPGHARMHSTMSRTRVDAVTPRALSTVSHVGMWASRAASGDGMASMAAVLAVVAASAGVASCASSNNAPVSPVPQPAAPTVLDAMPPAQRGWTARSLQAPMPAAPWDANWDLRESAQGATGLASSAKPKRRGTRHIILVRHGQYVSKHADMVAGVDTDEDYVCNDHLRKLTEQGRDQATAVGKALRELLPAHELRSPGTTLHLFSSDMCRANQTARLIREQLLPLAQDLPAHKWSGKQTDVDHGAGDNTAVLPLHVDSMLREGAPCWPEGYSGAWQPAPHEFHEEAARIEAAFRKHIHRAPASQEHDSVTILVCHGNVIRYFLMRALQMPPGAWLRCSVYNGCVTRLAIRDTGSVSVRSVGEALGQSPSMVTYH